MTSYKSEQYQERGERQALSKSLTTRERRAWFNKLTAAQEAIEQAEEALTKLMADAYVAGVSQAQIAGAVGLHSTSTRDRILRYLDDRKK